MLTVYAVDTATSDVEIVEGVRSVSYVERWNEATGGTVVVGGGSDPSTGWREVLARPFGGLLIVDRLGRAVSGWPYPAVSAASDGSVTIPFMLHICLLANRVVTPRTDAGNWTSRTYYQDSGSSRLVLGDLIDAFCGPNAPRPVGNITVAVGDPTGPNIAISARADLTVMDVIRDKGQASGDRVSALWTGSSIRFTIEPRVDVSGGVAFAPQLMNVESWKASIVQPEYDRVIVAGQGEGTSREVVVRESGRLGHTRDRFFDRRSIDTTGELEAEADELLAAGAGSVQVEADLLDEQEQAYGIDFRLGDLVKVSIPGLTTDVTEPLVEVVTSVDASGITRRATAGFGPLNSQAQRAADMAALGRRVSQIGAA